MTYDPAAGFFADVDPDGRPRLRVKLANGWTASIVLRQLARQSGTQDYDAASLAAWPTWQTLARPQLEQREQEATPDEVIEFLIELYGRPSIVPPEIARRIDPG